jgi:glycosyltransferase involved in cell wall biosynthesis
MKILALIESPGHVCYRYRIEAFAWALAERGLFLEAAPLEKGVRRRTGQLWRAGEAEAVILQRKLLPSWQLQLLRRRAKRLIYDVDDALFQRDSYSPKSARSAVRLKRFQATVRAADGVIAGNDYLRRYTAAYADPWRVHTVPTCVEPVWYPLATHARTGSAVRLAWIGQRSTLPSLDRAREHLTAVAACLPEIELRVISDAAPDLPGLRVVLRPWSAATEAAELADADIGVSWLPDDAWSLGKCGLRVLQYMAAGLPVVANPVGMNRRMVTHGETGFLASSPAEWAEAIACLAADPLLRARMGAAGRAAVEEHYSVEAWGPRLAVVMDEIVRGVPHVPEVVHGPTVKALPSPEMTADANTR